MSTPAQSLQALVAARKAQINRKKTIKPEPGANRYRILPSWRKNPDGTPQLGGQFYLDFGQHWIKDAMGKVLAVYVCVSRTFGKPCDVCDAVDHSIHAATNDAEIKRLKEAKAGSRVLVNALDLSGKPGVDPTQPQILELAPSIVNGDKNGVGGILSLLEQTSYKLLNFADGYDVIITKAGAGKEGTSYNVQVALDSKPISPDVMKRVNDLDEFVAQESVEQQRRALQALGAPAGVRALPAPTSTSLGAIPASPAASLADVQDEALRTIEAAPVVAPAPVAAAPVQPAPAVAATPAAPVTPATAAGGDPELEKLLSSI
jgi:hypothetical protein